MNRCGEVTVGPEGRVLIPGPARKALGIEPGSTLILRVERDRIVLIPREAVKRQLQDMFADVEGSMADELLAERRDESRRDTGAS